MKYQELKKFNLNSIKSQEEAIKWKDTVMASEKEDILKYVNFLRWQQFNQADIKYMNRIVQFLSFDELIDFERENSSIITGDTEDLVLLAETPKEEEKLANPVYIDGKEYSVKSVLEDDFESIMIVSDREGKLYKFGFIVLARLQGLELYAYELFEESQEYYKQIIDAKVGTKINIYCDIVGENQVTKTFKKSDLLIEEKSFVLATKTNKGIMSPVTKEGTYSILKKEEVISADGISEDRLANQISRFQQEIADKLGFKQSDIHTATQRAANTNKQKETTAEDFADDFKFSKKYFFSVQSPVEDEEFSAVNPLTHSILNFHGENKEKNEEEGGYFNEYEYVHEVYELLDKVFGIVEEMEGIWAIENTKLDRVVRKLIRAGADVEFISENANDFLKRFINQNSNRIMNPVMNLQIVKKIKTQKDIIEFAKDSGTELYVQIGQVMTAVLEGTQRLYGENHMVFDSDHKLIICKFDKLDLREASEYAIENGYNNFYVIEKDKFQQYDAWYKETLKGKDDEPTPTTVNSSDVSSNFVPTEEKCEDEKNHNNFDESKFVSPEVLNCGDDSDDEDENEEDLNLNNSKNNKVLYENDKPEDVVIMGTLFGDDSSFAITDDYSDFNIWKNGKLHKSKYSDSFENDGFTTVVSAKEFFSNLKKVGDGVGDPISAENIDNGDMGFDFILVKNFKGKMELKVEVEGIGDVPTENLNGEFLWHDSNLNKYYKANKSMDIGINIIGEFDSIIEIDGEVFEQEKLRISRENKLDRVVKEKIINEEFDKITTELCVKAIVEHFSDDEDEMTNPKNWKRLSKKGTGENIVREFENKENGCVVSVISSKTKISQVVADFEDEEDCQMTPCMIEEEFKDMNGYDIGDEFIFAIYEEPSATNEIGDPQFAVSINPLSYWNKCGYQYDQHLEHLLRKKYPFLNTVGFEEVMEGTFDFYDKRVDNFDLFKNQNCPYKHYDLAQTIDALCKSGIKFKLDFQKSMSSKDTTQVVNMINQLGYQSSII